MHSAHQYDDDACCIHCGHDGAEERHLQRLGYNYPKSSCPVWDTRVRAANYRRWIASSDPYVDVYGDDITDEQMLDQEQPD